MKIKWTNNEEYEFVTVKVYKELMFSGAVALYAHVCVCVDKNDFLCNMG